MTYGEIEFLDEPEPEPSPGAAQASPRFLLAVSAAGWLVAAVLCLIAPFRAVYGLSLGSRYADYAPGITTGVDGWGRSLLPDAFANGVRFGIALYLCAAVFVALAVLCVARTLGRSTGRPSWLRRATSAGVIGAPCLLAGVVATLGLYVWSVTTSPAATGWTSYTPLSVPASNSAYSSTLAISVPANTVGGCVWLSLGALGCAVIAAVAYLTAPAGAAPETASGRL